MGLKHASFIARTVLVQGDANASLKILNKIVANEGIFTLYKRTRRYEKPYMVRRRVNYERCRSLLNEDLNRKLNFLFRKNRKDPLPAC